MNRYISIVLIALLGACSGGSSSSPDTGGSNPVPAATPLPAPTSERIIDNEDLTAGLVGVDADKNGIRDDIDRLIAKKYSATPALKKAVEQDARALQRLMEATNRTQALFAGDEIMRAGDCISKILSERTVENEKLLISISKELSSLTANTKERFTKYWESNALAKGAVFQQPKEPVCD